MKLSSTLKSALPAVVIGFLTLGLAPSSAFATTTVTASPSLIVSATVVATCTIATTTMPFLNYTGVVANAQATVTVQCTNTTPYTITLDKGQGVGALITARNMTGPGAPLGYGLYTTNGYSTNFVATSGLLGTGSPVGTVIYGQIPANEYVTPGTYSDTIVATVTY